MTEQEMQGLAERLWEQWVDRHVYSDAWKRVMRQDYKRREAFTAAVRMMGPCYSACEQIKAEYGKVCADFELCKHESCNSSCGAWLKADAALSALAGNAGGGEPTVKVERCSNSVCGHSRGLHRVAGEWTKPYCTVEGCDCVSYE